MSVTRPTAIDSPLVLPQSAPGSPTQEPFEAPFPVRRFSVAEYERIGNAGILTEDDSVELLEGLIVEKMTKNPRHDALIDVLLRVFGRLLPQGWFPRAQNVLITGDSAPEPDLVIARGEPEDYWNRHPTGADVALVIEVAETSLARDRRKRHIYARAGILQYWIVNLTAEKLEVYAQPDVASSEYQRREIVNLRTAVSFELSPGVVLTLPLDTTLQRLPT